MVADDGVTGPRAALIGRTDRRGRLLWSLPKGHIEAGETPEDTAVREVAEETGIIGEVVAPLGIIDFWFVADGRRVHKTVHHFLLRADRRRALRRRHRGHRGRLGAARRVEQPAGLRRRAGTRRARARAAGRHRVSRTAAGRAAGRSAAGGPLTGALLAGPAVRRPLAVRGPLLALGLLTAAPAAAAARPTGGRADRSGRRLQTATGRSASRSAGSSPGPSPRGADDHRHRLPDQRGQPAAHRPRHPPAAGRGAAPPAPSSTTPSATPIPPRPSCPPFQDLPGTLAPGAQIGLHLHAPGRRPAARRGRRLPGAAEPQRRAPGRPAATGRGAVHVPRPAGRRPDGAHRRWPGCGPSRNAPT